MDDRFYRNEKGCFVEANSAASFAAIRIGPIGAGKRLTREDLLLILSECHIRGSE